jgi:hypothetical protein
MLILKAGSVRQGETRASELKQNQSAVRGMRGKNALSGRRI